MSDRIEQIRQEAPCNNAEPYDGYLGDEIKAADWDHWADEHLDWLLDQAEVAAEVSSREQEAYDEGFEAGAREGYEEGK